MDGSLLCRSTAQIDRMAGSISRIRLIPNSVVSLVGFQVRVRELPASLTLVLGFSFFVCTISNSSSTTPRRRRAIAQAVSSTMKATNCREIKIIGTHASLRFVLIFVLVLQRSSSNFAFLKHLHLNTCSCNPLLQSELLDSHVFQKRGIISQTFPLAFLSETLSPRNLCRDSTGILPRIFNDGTGESSICLTTTRIVDRRIVTGDTAVRRSAKFPKFRNGKLRGLFAASRSFGESK